MKVLCDRHHSDLLYALQRLFEDRLGFELYVPIGHDSPDTGWWGEGYWRFGEVWGDDRLARQFLSIDAQWREIEPGLYLTFDPCHSERPLYGMTLERAKKSKWDVVLATVQDNQKGFHRFAQDAGAKYAYHIGNTLQAIDWTLDPLILNASSSSMEGHDDRGVYIGQEFDYKTTFRYRPPDRLNAITSFVNLLPRIPESWEPFAELCKLLPFTARSFGHECPDGFLKPVAAVAEEMSRASWGYQDKPTGDGFGHCYDEKTEVLTNVGWKLFSQLDKTETIACLRDDELVYEKPTDYIAYSYEGEMLHFNTRSIDLMVTPEHRMYVSRYDKEANSTGWEIIKAKDCNFMGPSYNAKRALGFLKAPTKWNGKSGSGVYWPEFLGWYLSEGCLWKDKKRGYYHRVCIAQTNEDNKQRIAETIRGLGYHPQIYKTQVVVTSKELYEKIDALRLGLCDQKYIPREILDANRVSQQALLDTLLLGDGHEDKMSSGLWTLTTTSSRLADDTQELAIKLGYRTSLKKRSGYKTGYKDVYRVRISLVRRDKKCYKVPETIQYKGTVYCITVPSGVIMVRRNGEAVFCGNCIHNWAAIGRPLIGHGRFYAGQRAEIFWQDGITCIDLDKHSVADAAQIMTSMRPIAYKEMCRNIRRIFEDTYHPQEDALKVWTLLEGASSSSGRINLTK